MTGFGKLTKRISIFCFSALVLASCQSVDVGGLGTDGAETPNANVGTETSDTNQTVTQVANATALPAKGEIIGNGPVRVALILPLGGAPNIGAIASEIRNAAKLAVTDIGPDRIQLVIKDNKGRSELSKSLAGEAVKEGTSLILGPLLSTNVTATASVARPANVPMFSFSSNTAVASRGVYLMSFPPQPDVRRIISYAAAQGKKNLVAVIPTTAYGTVVEQELRSAAAANGITIGAIGKYTEKGSSDQIRASITKTVAALTNEVRVADMIYTPSSASIASAIVASIQATAVTTTDKQILGSGLWSTNRSNLESLKGAWFAGRNLKEFAAFSQRYQTIYSKEPGFNAALGYDAVTLAIGLSAQFGDQAFATKNMENPNGFSGLSGLFRFNAQGKPERGLVVYRYTGGAPTIISPAPTSFGQSG